MVINNNSDEIKYFDTYTKYFRSEAEIINMLSVEDSIFSKESLDNHIKNSSLYVYTPDKYYSVLNNIVPIPPKSSWLFNTKGFVINKQEYLFKKRDAKISDILTLVSRQLSKLRGKKIGVQLSGGLDSSLIISILRNFDIEPVLIGMYNNRYEFRTERIVQENLKKSALEYSLVCDDNFLPFTDLLNTPRHVLPNASSLFFSGELKMAQLFERSKVDIVFNGMGLDTILCLAPKDKESINQWHPFMFDDCWFRDYVYKPKNIYFTPAINSNFLVNTFWNLRWPLPEDNLKQWARYNFSNFLPKELTNFTYKADHAGLLIDGIKTNLLTIEYLFEFVYNETNLLEFSKDKFKKLFTNYHLSDDHKIKMILSMTSYAVWVYSLLKESST